MLDVWGRRHISANKAVLFASQVADEATPRVGGQTRVAVQTFALQPRGVGGKLSAGQGVEGLGPYGTVGVQVVEVPIGSSVIRRSRRAGIRTVAVMDSSVLKVRLQLSYVVVRVGLIWLVLVERPWAIHGLVVWRHLGARNGNGADSSGSRGGDVQRLNPTDGGVGWGVLSVAGVTQTRWAHRGHKLRPAARLGVDS